MSKFEQMKKTPYELALIGGGFSGLLLARFFSQKRDSVAMIDSEPSLAADVHSLMLGDMHCANVLRPFPYSSEAVEALNFFQISHERVSVGVRHFHNGYSNSDFDLGPNCEALPIALRSYCSAEQIVLQNEPGEMAMEIRKSLLMAKNMNFFQGQTVRRLTRSEAGVWQIETEGKRRVQAHQLLAWTDEARCLGWLPDSQQISRIRHKLGKAKVYTIVGADFVVAEGPVASSGESEHSLVHHLFEGVHFIGLSHSDRIWRWISCIEGETVAEEVEISSRLKLLRRGVHRLDSRLEDFSRVYVQVWPEPGLGSSRMTNAWTEECLSQGLSWQFSEPDEWSLLGAIRVAHRAAISVTEPVLDCPADEAHDSSLPVQ